MTQTDPSSPNSPSADERFARDVLRELALASVTEQRRRRRWNLFFRLLFLAVALGVLITALVPLATRTAGGAHAAVVEVVGVIASGTEASADNVIKGLRRAFENGNTAGVILDINSPGGSPVQASQIYDEIRRLRGEHPDIPVYAVAADLCASGGYYVAAAADRIYANRASLVGSIGVILGSFGFVEALDRLGVERRLYTAGENKDILDPFTPVEPGQVDYIESVLDTVHQQFIDAVKAGRGDRLDAAAHPEVFSGLFFTGQQALDMGLVDAPGSVRSVAEEVMGVERTVNFTVRQGILDQLATGLEARIEAFIQRLGTPSLTAP
ncbi:MAG: S49 family peptidase [Candidatus Competibacterales bacterium]